MTILAFLLTLLLVFASFAVLSAVATAALTPRLLTRLDRVAPAERARLLSGLAAAPLLLGVFLGALCLLPSMLGLAWPALDHCVDHGSHLHLCLSHWNMAAPPTWLALGGVGLLAAAAASGLGWLRRARRSRRHLDSLRRSATWSPELGAGILDVARPMALVYGFGRRSHLLISRSLLEGLSPESRAIVLAHEGTHVERRDNRRKLVARLTAWAHLPGTRDAILRALSLACEQACDERAAERFGRARVARALLDVERLSAEPAPNLVAVSQMATHLERRIVALLDPAPAPMRPRTQRWLLGGLLVALLTFDLLHHATETLLEVVLR